MYRQLPLSLKLEVNSLIGSTQRSYTPSTLNHLVYIHQNNFSRINPIFKDVEEVNFSKLLTTMSLIMSCRSCLSYCMCYNKSSTWNTWVNWPYETKFAQIVGEINEMNIYTGKFTFALFIFTAVISSEGICNLH